MFKKNSNESLELFPVQNIIHGTTQRKKKRKRKFNLKKLYTHLC